MQEDQDLASLKYLDEEDIKEATMRSYENDFGIIRIED